MSNVTWDHLGYYMDGQPQPFISGEFHYFRVPKQDWRRRMELFKEAGGNCVATYIPWIIHEPSEGDIRFGDVDARDLDAFLDTCEQTGLKAIVRPGPYQYSELVCSGLPRWLCENYPEIQAQDIDGNTIRLSSVSYLHPLFLEKAHIYYKKVCEVLRRHLDTLAMVQVDNELSGVHVWFGSLDYNPQAMGIGMEGGRYPLYLMRKYKTIEALNEHYGTDYTSFTQVSPRPCGTPVQKQRISRDYECFYNSTLADYIELLSSWLLEEGIDKPICHNAANPSMNAIFLEATKRMGKRFILASDHYYTLAPHWPQNSPTPQWALRVLTSLEELRLMGYPPSVFEMPGGSPSDIPPILPQDLLAAYMTNAAMGMKGVNYYVYTGGPNFEDTGETCDIYDYHAFISAEGEIRETYKALKEFGLFLQKNAWLQRAHRHTCVNLGFDFSTSSDWGSTGDQSPSAAAAFLRDGLLFSLISSPMPPALAVLDGELDIEVPLIVPCSDVMPRASQQNLVNFVKKGGKLLLMTKAPSLDEDYRSCTLLADELGLPEIRKAAQPDVRIKVLDMNRIYGMSTQYVCEETADWEPFAFGQESGSLLGIHRAMGAGEVWFLGIAYSAARHQEADMLCRVLAEMGVKPYIAASNPCVWAVVWENKEGRRLLYVLNLYSAPQSTTLTFPEGNTLTLDLGAMEVKAIEL